MKKSRNRVVFKDCIRKNKISLVVIALLLVSSIAIVKLYNIYAEPFIYACVFAVFVAVAVFIVDYAVELRKAGRRESIMNAIKSEWANLNAASGLMEEDYQEMVKALGHSLDTLSIELAQDKQDMLDYYTAWVHQIKTPIAVMKLHLTDDSDETRALQNELFRIEQYVDMVLHYIRLGSDTNDLVIQEYDLDEIIRETIRKYAPQFIAKKLKLSFEGTDAKIVTDKKWFVLILDQLISNAIKYTVDGQICIEYADGLLSISDTGIGIASEDLPRIFEKGYTGNNGRIGQKSSGLGLYLAKKAADKLAIKMSVISKVGEGTKFTLDVSQDKALH